MTVLRRPCTSFLAGLGGRATRLLILVLGSIAVIAAADVDITSVQVVGNGGHFITGELVTLQVTFEDPIDVDDIGTDPTLALNGGGSAIATYAGGDATNTSTLLFTYIVPAGQSTSSLAPHTDALIVANDAVFTPNGGGMATVNLALPTASIVSTIGAVTTEINHHETVTAIAILGNGTNYTTGQALSLQVTFSGAVVVTGTPTLSLDSGGVAAYAGGSGSSVLSFTYVVGINDTTGGLKAVDSTPFGLTGATLRNADRPIDADLAYGAAATNLPPTSGAAATTINLPATIATVAVVQAAGTYYPGDVLDLRVTFSGLVDVTGTPIITLGNGGIASYISGTGSNTVLFRYAVGTGQAADPLAHGANALTLAGGTISNDNSGVAANLACSPGAFAGIVVATNPAPATVSNLTVSQAAGDYTSGQALDVVITFSGAVTVTGTPTVALNSGGTAAYSSGSGTASLTFSYLVGASHVSALLDCATTAPFLLPGGATIRNAGTPVAAALTCATSGAGSIGANKAVSVNLAPSIITGVTVTEADGVYLTGTTLHLAVTFSGAVDVAGGAPTMALNSGSTLAIYAGGTGTNTLVFNYAIAAGDSTLDLDYASTAPFALAGATIRNAGTLRAASLACATPATAGSVSDNQAIRVNPGPRAFLGGAGVADIPAGSLNFPPASAPFETVIAGNGVVSPGATLIDTLTVTLVDHPDGTSESIGLSASTVTTGAPYTLVTVGSFNNITGTLTITRNGSPNGVDYTTILRALVYRHVSPDAASPGDRRVRFTVSDTTGRIGAESTATLTVASNRPVLRLSGVTAAPNTTLTYTEASGALPISPAATIANPTPIWQPNVSGNPWVPYEIYVMRGTDDLISYRGGVLDSLVITMTNPDGDGLFPDDGSESITMSLPAEHSFYAAPIVGNFLAYNGQGGIPYPMFSIRYPGPVFTTVNGTATTQTLTVSGAQDASQAGQPIPAPGTRPIPTATIENIVRSLRYTNTSTSPTRYGTRRLITVTVTNSSTTSPAKTSLETTCLVTIVPTNDVPVVGGPASYSVPEDTELALNGLTVNDVDGGGGNETLTLSVDRGKLRIISTTGLTVQGYNTGTLLLTGALTGTSGALASALAAGNIIYDPDDLFNGTDFLSLSLNDLGNTGQTPQTGVLASPIPITVTPINQPPTVMVPSSRTVGESTDLAVPNIAIADSDAGTRLVQVTVEVTPSRGTVRLTETSGLVAGFNDAEGDGTDTLALLMQPSAQLIFRGTLANIGSALNTLVYRGSPNFYGDHDTITLQVNDLGGSGVRVGAPPTGVTASPAAGSQAWITTATIDVVVSFSNAAPVLLPSATNPLTENRGIAVPVNDTVLLRGGATVTPTYPAYGQRLSNLFADQVPTNAGTTVLSTSNLVAWDEETKDPRGLTYVINLGVTQGRLLRKRPFPADPVSGTPIVAVPASGEANTFTQDDLNRGYLTYTHNGSTSGDDGFVFTVRDDNALSCPLVFASPTPVNGESSTIVFNISIDRTLPQVILSGSAPVFNEPVPPALAVPVLVDSGVQLFNLSDTNSPKQLTAAGNNGARVIASLGIPAGTRVDVHPAPADQGGDGLDVIGIQDSGAVHVGPRDATTGITPLSYGGGSFAAGVPIGSFTGGQGGVPLVVSFSSPSPVLVTTAEDVIKHLTYSNSSPNPSASPREISIQVVNGAAGASVAVSKTVGVLPYNQAPVLTAGRRLLAVPNVAVPFTITRGPITGAAIAQISDPESDVTYTVSPPPIKGTVDFDALSGGFIYTAATPSASATGIATDAFTIVATDHGLVSDPRQKSSVPLVIEVVITDTGIFAPVIDSNPPLEVVQGSLLSYTPTVVLPVSGRLGLTSNLAFTLIDTGPATTPALGFSASDGTITWPTGWSLPAGTGAEAGVTYQRLGILVNDLANETAAHQQVMLRVVQAPTGVN